MITTKQKRREQYLKNKDRIYKAHRTYIRNHSEARKIYLKKYYETHKERRKLLYRKNIEKHRRLDREHYHRNRERHRELRIALAHGITVEEYRTLHKVSKGLCGICGKPERGINKRYGNLKVLAVDHNHMTGKVRGLLCQSCNQAIGLLHEDLNLLEKIRSYLTLYARTA